MAKFDYVFITHLPAFYKINLYNELAKHCRVYVIFIAASSVIRKGDFTNGQYQFDFSLLNSESFEKRSKLQSLYKLHKILRKLSYKQLVVGGWDLPEFWLAILFSGPKRSCLALESSFYECSHTGLKGWLKKLFLKRLNLVFASGEPHCVLLEKLKFKGKVKKTLGVGIFNYFAKEKTKNDFSGKFLYVGRLAPEKNLSLLIEVFKDLPQYGLSIIGTGPLNFSTSDNIQLLGHVPNAELANYYESHDAFILPSLREPWGLVVEEALYYGLPIIVSNRVGCAIDLVQNWEVGVTFDPFKKKNLQDAILSLINDYQYYSENAKKIDFKVRDIHQIAQYFEALN